MKVSNALYTYPVLSSQGLRDDYIPGSHFSSTIQRLQTGASEISLDLSIALVDDNLMNLVRDGDAKIVCHIESPLTSHRVVRQINAFDMHIVLTVNPQNMRGLLEVTAFIIAERQLSQFTSNTFSELYAGAYALDKGDVLAFAPTIEIDIEPEDIDKQPTQSIIKICGHDKREIVTDLTGEYILVRIPEDTYASYKKLSRKENAHYKISLMAVVLPALMDAITDLKYGDGSSDNKVWSRVIRAKLKAGGRGSDPTQYDPLIHSQFLLNNPADGMFTPIIDTALNQFSSYEDERND